MTGKNTKVSLFLGGNSFTIHSELSNFPPHEGFSESVPACEPGAVQFLDLRL